MGPYPMITLNSLDTNMASVTPVKKNTKIFWTGGWDSTFQLLRLLLVDKIQVTPFYLIDEDRKSTGVEIQTMNQIKKYLIAEYPHTRGLLLPTQYFGVSDIVHDTKIDDAFEAIKKERHLGIQYNWLARFCKQQSISDIHLCIHRDDVGHAVIQEFVEIVNKEHRSTFRINPDFHTTHEYTLFRYYHFPMFDISKVQMAAISTEKGWNDVMGMTWFCHHPRNGINGIRPCGTCNPCVYTIEEGLGWRIPKITRIKSFLYKNTLRPFVLYIQNSPYWKPIAKKALVNINLLLKRI